MNAHSAFELLARPIQHVLWDMNWPQLRPIQEEAIQLLMRTEADVIISAQTAAGKTEAAFLPIISRLFESPAKSVQALYVGPLKALINDQFRRLERLCGRAKISVHRWHGDVDAGKKKALVSHPSGILLITPESIESLFINRSTRLVGLFQSLDFVVIDEIHALVGSERGTHLRSLLHRLQDHVKEPFRLIGLSATLGEAFPIYERWLRPDSDREVRLVQGVSSEKRRLYKIHAYSITRRPKEDEVDASVDCCTPEMTNDIFRHFCGTKGLVFTNRKSDIEQLADALNAKCRAEVRPEEFLVHHGSLSKEVREFAEQEMQGGSPKTTICSSTLELGIDIGSVASVGQVDPPWSVGSLVQRMGRSGRGENEPQCMRMYIREEEVTADSSLIHRLYPSLLRAIALTELMLQDPPWVEPPNLEAHDLSTLTHQVLSILTETGGRPADRLYDTLCRRGGFRSIDSKQFVGVLRSLGSRGVIQQMEAGDLILTPKGEMITGHYSFYSAFATPEEFSVYSGPQLLGMLPVSSLPRPDDFLLLAGRRWQVITIDFDRKAIVVKSAKGKKIPYFVSGGGDVHSRVAQVMRDILLDDRHYSYLNATGSRLFSEARRTAMDVGLASRTFISISPKSTVWFTWTSTKIQRTLCMVADALGLSHRDHGLAIELQATPDQAIGLLKSVNSSTLDGIRLAERVPAKHLRKFDEYLDESLLIESLAADVLDVRGAAEVLINLQK